MQGARQGRLGSFPAFGLGAGAQSRGFREFWIFANRLIPIIGSGYRELGIPGGGWRMGGGLSA
ncbi:hypothetical protein AchV4_0063 [Achromobacter phage vB_AchrS_AchV4]|uniref:Uncharacterized protein n=1 Tax=Achromobacter phage vB_AchrS_AchV4 TaxID=2796514 RepID=A0A7T3PGZ5_9CAUD|nr:hypothetical protein JT316_gp63 [Achromobacter phage vB_AchrS_AchV4]QPZ53316.1 hypothetical protein AchV4_0063 [Achromobacter phage vB_AchrS_AchV4]